MSEKLIKDYKGDLIKKSKSRKILGKIYEEEVSCFCMPDGQWYRVTSTDKIVYDHALKKYVLRSDNKLVEGIVNAKEERGFFSQGHDEIMLKRRTSSKDGRGSYSDYSMCMNEEVAEKLGYEESIADGGFYRKSEITNDERKGWFSKKTIPNNERSKSYNLESDPEKKKSLQEAYDKLDIKPNASAKSIGKIIGDLTFGLEVEVINGFLPSRIRNKYGIKSLKDGSLRSENGEGIEFVSMPMGGAKGVEVIRAFCKELSKRCEVNDYCSVHIHYGNVRKDKLYVLSLYSLAVKIQSEIGKYFPHSRFNSIKADGKVYCKKLESLGINYPNILKSTNEEKFKANVITEFNKLYAWLNRGKILGEEYAERSVERVYKINPDGKKMFCDSWLRNVYTVKSTYHSIQGNKWDKAERYFWINFLNLFFSPIGTVEFRVHEASTNFTKIACWMIITSSILRFAEDIKTCMSKDKKITLNDVLKSTCNDSLRSYIMEYMNLRNSTFYCNDGSYRSDTRKIEAKWFREDSNFEFIFDKVALI